MKKNISKNKAIELANKSLDEHSCIKDYKILSNRKYYSRKIRKNGEIFRNIGIALLIAVPIGFGLLYTILLSSRGFYKYDVKIGEHEYLIESVRYSERGNNLVFSTMKEQKIFPINNREHSITTLGEADIKNNDDLVIQKIK